MHAATNQCQTRFAVWEVLTLTLLTSAIIWPTMQQFVERWRPDPENVLGHGWLVVGVALWGLVKDARALPVMAPWRPKLLPAAVSVAVGIAWAVAQQGAVVGVQQLLWPLLIASVLWVALGGPALRQLFPALLLLWFASPLWTLLHGFLWTTSTNAVHMILSLLGIPVHFDGNVISLPAGQIQIAAGCAGLAFFTAAVACGGIIGYLNRANWRQQLLLIAVAGAMAMVSNWLRIVTIVVQAHRTNMQTPLITVSHYAFGWTLFAVGLLAYCFIFGRYGLRVVAHSKAAAAMSFRPLPLLAALVCAALGPMAVVASPVPVLSEPNESVLVLRSVAWQPVVRQDSTAWHPQFAGADEAALYQSAAADSDFLYANLYRQQSATHKLISSNNALVPNEQWQAEGARDGGGAAEMTAIDPEGHHWLLRYMYVAGKSLSTVPWVSQWSYAVQRFAAIPAAGIVIVAARCGTDCAAAQVRLADSWEKFGMLLVGQIQSASR